MSTSAQVGGKCLSKLQVPARDDLVPVDYNDTQNNMPTMRRIVGIFMSSPIWPGNNQAQHQINSIS